MIATAPSCCRTRSSSASIFQQASSLPGLILMSLSLGASLVRATAPATPAIASRDG